MCVIGSLTEPAHAQIVLCLLSVHEFPCSHTQYGRQDEGVITVQFHFDVYNSNVHCMFKSW